MVEGANSYARPELVFSVKGEIGICTRGLGMLRSQEDT
jgi:hypothetical protein